MNKMIKGSVAGATGIVLLMGGFGTYALWSDSASLPQSSVSSGVLDIAAGAVAWKDASLGTTTDTWNPSSDLMVPGDTITRTQTFAITGTGKNLKGAVDFAEGPASGTSSGLTVSVVVTSDNAVVTPAADPNDYKFVAPFGTATLTAVVTYALPSGTSGQADQNVTKTLADSTFTITQTR